MQRQEWLTCWSQWSRPAREGDSNYDEQNQEIGWYHLEKERRYEGEGNTGCNFKSSDDSIDCQKSRNRQDSQRLHLHLACLELASYSIVLVVLALHSLFASNIVNIAPIIFLLLPFQSSDTCKLSTMNNSKLWLWVIFRDFTLLSRSLIP